MIIYGVVPACCTIEELLDIVKEVLKSQYFVILLKMENETRFSGQLY